MKNNNLEPDKILACLNCEAKINSSNSFCQNCGQAIKSYRLSVWLLVKEVFSSIFNLDSKFVKTISNIWRPVFLTKAYVAGERKRYLNPGRLYIVSFFILSASISYYAKVESDKNGDIKETKNLFIDSFKDDMLVLFDSLSNQYPSSPAVSIDSIRYGIFFSKNQTALDSISSPPPLMIFEFDDGNKAAIGNRKYKIATSDIISLSGEELFEKYKVDGFKERLYLVQYLKFIKNPNAWKVFMITNSLWTIVLATFVLALLMKVLYVRRKYYYVEHLVLLMMLQNLFFVLSIVIVALEIFEFNFVSEDSIPYFFLVGFALINWTLRKYYQQSWIKTFIKSILIFILFVFIMSMCLLLVVGISAALF